VVTYLLSIHAEMNVQDLEGISPLHWAVLRGHEAVVELLLKNGAYPNYMENTGNKSTPLDYAAAAVEDEALSARLVALLSAHGGVDYETMRYLATIVLQAGVRGTLARRATKELQKRNRASMVWLGCCFLSHLAHINFIFHCFAGDHGGVPHAHDAAGLSQSARRRHYDPSALSRVRAAQALSSAARCGAVAKDGRGTEARGRRGRRRRGT
jgi:ankyrin repeat protein